MYQEQYGEVPDNLFVMAWRNFQKELGALRRSFRKNEYSTIAQQRGEKGLLDKAAYSAGGFLVKGMSALDESLESNKLLGKLEDMPQPLYNIADPNEVPEQCKEILDKLKKLELDDAAVIARERNRVAKEGKTESPLIIRLPFDILCWVLDLAYQNRPIQRFWTLEVIARIPYFAYISILHLYESLGFWRAGAELRKVHFAEEWNEMHHLQIMESLGGDVAWVDRFVAEHTAVLYYWMLIIFYLASPRLAYNFMELVELHAMDTYATFVEQNSALLKTIPPPMVAIQYYKAGDLYLFDTITSDSTKEARRPDVNNLYDVFCNVRDDELQHVKTMKACQSTKIAQELAQKRKQVEA